MAPKTNNYTPVDSKVLSEILYATEGSVKIGTAKKTVDPRGLIGSIHVKKHVAIGSINKSFEDWISIVKRIKDSEEVSADDLATLEVAKEETTKYLETSASATLKENVANCDDANLNIKRIAESMKYKFSSFAYDAITCSVNLMVRELIISANENCLKAGSKITSTKHFDWPSMTNLALAPLYMNTKTVWDAIHPKSEEVVEEVEETEEVETSDETTTAKPKVEIPLKQYINHVSNEINTNKRYSTLSLGTPVRKVINDIIFEVFARYVNVVKSLLAAADSKTVNDHIAVIATKILLQDYIWSTTDQVSVVLDVVQDYVEKRKTLKASKKGVSSDEDAEDDVEDEVVEEVAAPKKKGSKK